MVDLCRLLAVVVPRFAIPTRVGTRYVYSSVA
jgi:hypothetical protein